MQRRHDKRLKLSRLLYGCNVILKNNILLYVLNLFIDIKILKCEDIKIEILHTHILYLFEWFIC